MQEKVTIADIKRIKAGETITFELPSELARHSAKSLAYQVAKLYPRNGILKYACENVKTEVEGVFPISITALMAE